MLESRTMLFSFLFFALALLQHCGGNHIYHVVTNETLSCTVDLCLTLTEYAEDAERYFTSDTIVRFLPGNHTLDVGGFVEVRNVRNLSLVGEDRQGFNGPGLIEPVSRIICSGSSQFLSSGFAFINVSILRIERLLFFNCGAPTIKFEPDIEEQLHSIFNIGRGMRVALLFFNVESLKIINATVQKSFGYGSLGLNAFQTLISGSVFAENNIRTYTAPECIKCTSADAYCIGGNALFVFQDYASKECTNTTHTLNITSNTHFIYGVDVCRKYLGRVHSGGGLGVLFGQSSYGVQVNIHDTYMKGNTGTDGGNLYLEFMDFARSSSVIIESSYLEYGNVRFSLVDRITHKGGGLGLYHGILHGKGYKPKCQHTRNLNTFSMSDCKVVHNQAINAAGGFFLTAISNYPNLFSIRITINASIFSENIALDASAVLIAEMKLSPYVNPLLNQILFQNTKFSSNRFPLDKDFLSYISNTTINTLLGVVWVASSPRLWIDNCTFNDNELPGLAASDSNVIFRGDNSFRSNYGLRGGGMGLSQSTMYMLPRTHINFVSNFALQRGGGIYVDNSPLTINYCFFQIYDPNELNDTQLDIAITFQNNSAVESGTSLYGGTVDHCVASTHSSFSDRLSSETANYIFHFNDSGHSVVSSDPFRVCFCTTSDDYDCSIQIHSVKVYRGQRFQVSTVAVGQRNGTAPAVINTVMFSSDKEAHLGKSQDTQKISQTCTPMDYSVFSNSEVEILKLSVEGAGRLYGYVTTLRVIFRPCPPGFNYTPTSPGCDCSSFLSKHGIQNCDISSQTVLKKELMWIGFQGLKAHTHCSPDYCKAGEMNITLDDPDIQCAFNHSGILCGACMPNLSLVLGGSQCLECSNSYLALIALFVMFGILLVFVLLLLNLTTAVGTTNGLIFYVNIIVMNRGVFFPSATTTPYGKLLSIFIAWMNLDFGIEVCFANGMDAYIRTWLQFVFPAYIWALVGLIIIASRYSVTLSNHLATNAVPVLATLFLLSYTKILRTIIAALSFTFLDLPDETREAVWLHDGNVPYLKGKHIALAVFGIIVFFLTAIPYTFLLLFGQLLQAVSNRRLFQWTNKMIPLFDAYYAPYKNKHRYWSGLLLLVRFTVLVAISINSAADPGINLVTVGCSAIFILSFSMSVGGVYRKWYLTVLESSYFINLIICVLIVFYFRQAADKQRAAVRGSISVALATFIGIVALHLIWKTHLWVLIKPKLERLATAWHTQNRSEENAELLSLDDFHQSFPATTYIDFREPLIHSQQNDPE